MDSKAEKWRKKVNEYHQKENDDTHNDRYFREPGFYDEFDEPSEESCKRLWSLIISFADHEVFVRADKEIYRRLAKHWFTNQKEDFGTVCDYAGVNPKAVLKEYYSRTNKLRRK